MGRGHITFKCPTKKTMLLKENGGITDGSLSEYALSSDEESEEEVPRGDLFMMKEAALMLLGKYEDTITYDVVLMEACHLLLGRPCQYNKERKVTLTHLSPREYFDDVFLKEVPHGLQPIRGIEHRNNLIPDVSLPNRKTYRTNPQETKEIQRQVEDLVQKG
uniref:Uncharacterized protein LOC105851302 n=1 Tax=Cicer arietinum TaxID=3827 RepID=A0A1S3DW65_CICAR|nr:uncharacterized protein LOC105851302 [Cicer arietinum]